MSCILDLASNRSLLSEFKGIQPLPQEELIMKGKTHFPEMQLFGKHHVRSFFYRSLKRREKQHGQGKLLRMLVHL